MKECARCLHLMQDDAARCARCGAELGERASSAPTIDGRYVVEGELGRGAMGVVHIARDLGLGRRVALKIVSPELAGDPEFFERFRLEAMALAAIRDDHVVQVYAFGQHEGAPFFAMELVRGKNLQTIVRDHFEHGTFVPTYRALTIVRQIASGLSAAHTSGIVHHDVKPANIVIEEGTGRPVLVDFGLARAMYGRRAGGGGVHGSPAYMAPEQLAPPGSAPAPIGPHTDIYALGCTAFELLTGHPPFDGDDVLDVIRKQRSMPAPPISSRRLDLAMLDPVLERALAKRPEDRYDSAASFAAALTSAAIQWRATDATVEPPPPSNETLGPGAPAPLRILVVDDDAWFCSFAARASQLALANLPVEVDLAESWHEALASALRAPPQIIVLDYDMPGLNGVETLSHLRGLPTAGRAQVLVVSANVGAMERWRFSVLGVQDFLAKPVDLRDFAAAIARLALRMEGPAIPTSTVIPRSSVSAPPASLECSASSPLAELAGRRPPVEAFLTILALRWARDAIDPSETAEIVRGARGAGLPDAEVARVEAASREPVLVAELEYARLSTAERMLVYAAASYAADPSGERDPGLDLLPYVIGLGARERTLVERAIAALSSSRSAPRPARFDVAALKKALAEPPAPFTVRPADTG